MSFEEWFEKNYSNEEYDEQYQSHTLDKKEVGGTSLLGVDIQDLRDTIEASCEITWNHQQSKIDQLEKQLEKAEKALSYYADDENWILDFDTGMPFIREENDGETAREYFKSKE